MALEVDRTPPDRTSVAETCLSVLARSIQLRKNRSRDDDKIPGVDGAGSCGRLGV